MPVTFNNRFFKFLSVFLAFAALLFFSKPASTSCLDQELDFRANNWRTSSPTKADKLKGHSKPIERIVVQWTGTPRRTNTGGKIDLERFYNYLTSDKVGFADVPFHFYIDGKGKSFEARDVKYQSESKSSSFQPFLNGQLSISVQGTEGDSISKEQLDELEKLLRALQNEYNLPASAIHKHNDFAGTMSPGPEISQFIDRYRKNPTFANPDPTLCSEDSGPILLRPVPPLQTQ